MCARVIEEWEKDLRIKENAIFLIKKEDLCSLLSTFRGISLYFNEENWLLMFFIGGVGCKEL